LFGWFLFWFFILFLFIFSLFWCLYFSQIILLIILKLLKICEFTSAFFVAAGTDGAVVPSTIFQSSPVAFLYSSFNANKTLTCLVTSSLVALFAFIVLTSSA